MPSVVRIHLPPPNRSKLYIACSDFFTKDRARSCRCSSFPNQTRSAGLRFGVGCRPENCGICSVLRLRKSASFERSLPIFTYSLLPSGNLCAERPEMCRLPQPGSGPVTFGPAGSLRCRSFDRLSFPALPFFSELFNKAQFPP